ncbi:hypothetical protein [Roseomonas indoligenes]|uniref:Uncharacterized protein n=1 Tax=Roseomonas indoligenes TaxID=2820811 RepID=A0A940MYW9_9PROT|nr:hypothetical protein [Pararoseomonas indoligenes]MBP0493727.1 hypothetical protein [Pararoseomonas indoligenes]
MMTKEEVIRELRLELRNLIRELENLARAADYLGVPEFSAVLRNTGALLAEQEPSEPWPLGAPSGAGAGTSHI